MTGALNSIFPSLLRDNQLLNNERELNDYSARTGLLLLATHLFKCFFRLNNIRLCTQVIKQIELRRDVFERDLAFFPKGDVVTYHYYGGMIAMFEEEYVKADTYLSLAFSQCHKDSLRHKRFILQYLIPIKLSMGYLPPNTLIKKYNLVMFEDLIISVKSGNLRLFDETLEKYLGIFIKNGTYLVLEKLKLLVIRNLFKRT